jgi:flagellar biogenesis protein FliO
VPWSFWAGYVVKLAIVGFALTILYAIGRKLRQSRFFASGSGRRVTVVETAALSQHAAVYLVRIGTRYFLVGAGSAAVSMLAELERGEIDAIR